MTTRGEWVAGVLGAVVILLLLWAAEALAFAVTGVPG